MGDDYTLADVAADVASLETRVDHIEEMMKEAFVEIEEMLRGIKDHVGYTPSSDPPGSPTFR